MILILSEWVVGIAAGGTAAFGIAACTSRLSGVQQTLNWLYVYTPSPASWCGSAVHQCRPTVYVFIPSSEYGSSALLRNIYTTLFSRKSAAQKIETRMLSYRKDDRAMRHMYRCAENVRESLSTSTATNA